MTKEEALTIIKGYKIYSLGHSNHSEAFDIAEECIQHCIDEEEDVCYNCYDKHCENCLYSGRIPD